MNDAPGVAQDERSGFARPDDHTPHLLGHGPVPVTGSHQPEAHARLEALYDEHARSVLRYARRRLPREDAEDVVCDVFLVAWRRLDDIPELELAWLLGVARRTVANRLRSERRSGDLLSRVRLHARRSVPDHAPSVDTGDQISRAFQQLSTTDQDVLRLVVTEGLTSAELGVALGCSTNTASTRARRARERLAALLGPDADEAAEDHDRPGAADPADPRTTRHRTHDERIPHGQQA